MVIAVRSKSLQARARGEGPRRIAIQWQSSGGLCIYWLFMVAA